MVKPPTPEEEDRLPSLPRAQSADHWARARLGHWVNEFTLRHDGPDRWPSNANKDVAASMAVRWRLRAESSWTHAACVALFDGIRDGSLAIIVSADHPVETISVPTAFAAMRYALARDGARVEPDAERGTFICEEKLPGPSHPTRLDI
jgi:hypothetical protein